eukprot:s10404_g1.t1
MSLPDSVDTQNTAWAEQAEDVAEAMALATAPTQELSGFAETQVVPATPPSNPKSPLESSADGSCKTKANDAALSALASTKSKEEALASTKSKEGTLNASTKSEEGTLNASAKSEEGTLNASTKPVSDAKLTDEAMLQARKAFADHHGLLLENVTPDMIVGDACGAVYWATKSINLSARSPVSQAMGRAIKHHPEVKELYTILLDSEKVKFRAAWAATRDWEFVNVERSTTNSYRKRKEEVGAFKAQLQIEHILGGSDKPEAVLQAKNYISMCLRPDLKARIPQ